MAISCVPNDLMEASKCFRCMTRQQQEAVKTYLLAVMAGGSTDPDVLEPLAKCFECLTRKQLLAIQNYLLCQIINV